MYRPTWLEALRALFQHVVLFERGGESHDHIRVDDGDAFWFVATFEEETRLQLDFHDIWFLHPKRNDFPPAIPVACHFGSAKDTFCEGSAQQTKAKPPHVFDIRLSHNGGCLNAVFFSFTCFFWGVARQ